MKMNKIAMFFAATAAVLSMSSCKQNTEPRYHEATVFTLNTPALAQQYYQLTPEGTIDLTWSQPNWGFSAAAQYDVQISLMPDFTPAEEGLDAYYTLPNNNTPISICSASILASDVAMGICKLRGIADEDSYTPEPARPVYVRVVGRVPQVAESDIVSNTICLSKVEGYCAIQSPGKIYLVGAPEGWKGPDAAAADHYASWALKEKDDEIGSQVYYGTFDIPAGNAMFRFYTALTGWDADSWGSQEADSPLDFDFTNGEFVGAIVKGKGAFNFHNWPGGKMDICVDMVHHQLIIKAL